MFTQTIRDRFEIIQHYVRDRAAVMDLGCVDSRPARHDAAAEHAAQAERHFDATRTTLKYYGEWYGAYPYGHVTIVDPAGAPQASAAARRTASDTAPTRAPT